MEVLECVLHQMWIALLVKIVSSEGDIKVFMRFGLLSAQAWPRTYVERWALSPIAFIRWLVVVCAVWSSGRIQLVHRALLLLSKLNLITHKTLRTRDWRKRMNNAIKQEGSRKVGPKLILTQVWSRATKICSGSHMEVKKNVNWPKPVDLKYLECIIGNVCHLQLCSFA